MAWIIERLGEDLSESDRESIAEHLRTCPECARQLQRMAALAPAIAEASGEIDEPTDHLTAMDMADFAAHGYDAEGASAIALHLSQCRRCRSAFAAAHSSLVRYEQERDDSTWWRARLASLRMAVSTPGGVLLTVLALLAYLGECLVLAFAAGQLLFAWVIPPTGYEALPEWWPLTAVPAGLARLVVLVLLSAGLALLLRKGAGALYAYARSRGGGPAQ
jgi:hypothetical protein